jgi:hypothetical protein
METLDKIVPRALLVVSAGLLCWGLLGLLEYAFPALGLGLQNSGFPAGLQFLHFFAIALTGTIFVLGYLDPFPFHPPAFCRDAARKQGIGSQPGYPVRRETGGCGLRRGHSPR